MSQIKIGRFLKQIRKASGCSVNEASCKLKTYDFSVANKTIYGYENGHTVPPADLFLALCKIYECANPLVIFDSTPMTKKEISIIKTYRKLDSNGQKILDIILEAELYRSLEIKKILELHQKAENK